MDRSGNAPFLGAGGQKVGWAKSTTVSDADFRWNPAKAGTTPTLNWAVSIDHNFSLGPNQ